jgi:regulator of sigma E protease
VELHRAFNRQSVGRRFAIVSAGPIANFLLAVLLYWGLFIHGTEELRPVLAAPAAGTPAAMAGVTEGELVRSIDGKNIISAQDLRWNVARAAVEGATLMLETVSVSNEVHFRRVDLSGVGAEVDASLMERAGLQQFRPRMPPVVGAVTADGAAARAGVLPGDRILSIDGQSLDDWMTLVGLVRERGGRTVTLEGFPRR